MEKELISLVAATLFKTWDGNGDFSKIKESNKKPWLDSAKAIVDEISKYYVISGNDINYFDEESTVNATAIVRGSEIRCIYINDYRVFGRKPIPGENYVEMTGKVGDVVNAIPELSRLLKAPRVSAVK